MSVFNVMICILGGAFIGALITFVSMALVLAAGEDHENK